MKKFSIVLAMLLAGNFVRAYAQSAAAFFYSLPLEEVTLLDETMRKDMVALKEAGRSSVTVNLMGGNSEIKIINESYVKVQLTTSTTLELKVLAINDTLSIACLATTVTSSIPDSRVMFYNIKGESINPQQYFTPPTLKDFFEKKSKKELKEISEQIDALFVCYDLSPDSNELKARFTSDKYLPTTHQLLGKTLNEPTLVYYWKKRFIR